MSVGLGLVSVFVWVQHFVCAFFCFSSDYFVLVLFAFVVLDLVSSKNVSKMTCFASSETKTLTR